MYDNNDNIFEQNTIPNEEPTIPAEPVEVEPEIVLPPVTEDTPMEDTEVLAPVPEVVEEEPKGQFSQNVWMEPTTAQSQKKAKKTHKKRNQNSWSKRVLVLLLCGILLGSSGAAAYLGVLYVGKNVLDIEEGATTTTENVEIIEIPQAGVIAPAPGDDGTGLGVVSYDVTTVVENVMPAMVSIINNYTETYSSFFGQSYTQQGASSGSGIIIGQNEAELLIATNYHVISGNDSLEITFIDGTKAAAYIKGTNPQMDLAVVSVVLTDLSVETRATIAVASMGNSDNLKLGESVIAIGNALGYGQSVTTGVVSAIDREVQAEDGTVGKFIQTDAAINPGNSGGALLNVRGEVIGINSSKIGGTYVEGIGYAIPISAAEPIISDLSLLETKMKVNPEERGYLGISIDEIDSETSRRFNIPQGVFVASVQKGSGADLGGMRVNDIIVKFDSFTIESYADLQEAMEYYKVGVTVPVEVMRIQNGSYESVTLQITLGAKAE